MKLLVKKLASPITSYTLNKHKKIIVLIIHVATWICFFLLPYIFFPKSKYLPFEISQYLIILLLIINIFLLAFYYFNTLILIPHLLFKKKWLYYLISILINFTAFFFVPKEITYWITGNDDETIKQEIIQHRAEKEKVKLQLSNNSNQYHQKHTHNMFRQNNNFKYFPGSYAVFILVFAVGTCISVIKEWKKTEDYRDQIENEKISSELAFLKSQINPHFLFNTLNNIYSLAITESTETASAVMKLSSIMRYILTDTQDERVTLQSEINFIKNYLDLQLVRLTNKVKVSFTTDGEIENKQIAPLLFIPFIENAFKYGISTKEFSTIEIKILSLKNNIYFSILNTIIKTEDSIKDNTGIGINNVKRRLELLYPKKYTLEIIENNNQFIVHLNIIGS